MALISKMHDGVVFLHGIKELIPISIDVIKGSSPLWPGRRSRHSRRMHNQQFYVSRLRPIAFVRLLSDFLTNGHPRWDNFLVTGGDCPHKNIVRHTAHTIVSCKTFRSYCSLGAVICACHKIADLGQHILTQIFYTVRFSFNIRLDYKYPEGTKIQHP